MALDPLATPIVFTAPGSTHAIGIVGNGNQREFALYAAPIASLGQGAPAWRRVAGLDDDVTDAALIGGTLYVCSRTRARRTSRSLRARSREPRPRRRRRSWFRRARR